MNLTEEQKERLMVKFLQGLCSDEETQSFLEWLKESEENKKDFFEFRDIWYATEIETVISPEGTNREWKRFRNNNINKTRSIFTGYKRLLRIAAIFLVGLMLLWGSYFFTNQLFYEIQFTEISAPLGSKSQLVLPDGSKVWLNSGSKIKYSNRFNKKSRELHLEGEAYFDVSRNEQKPFFVNTTLLKVRVLGTQFNVKCYPEEQTIETTVISGSVEIENKCKESKAKKNLVLEPDQKVTFVKNKGKLELAKSTTEKSKAHIEENKELEGSQAIPLKKVKTIILNQDVDTKLLTAWKDGKLIFKSEAFETIARKLERWYDVKIIIESDELKNSKFTGTFESKETINQLLEIVKLTTPIEYEIDQNIIHITHQIN